MALPFYKKENDQSKLLPECCGDGAPLIWMLQKARNMSIEIVYDLHYYCSCNSLEKSGHKISQGYFLTYFPSLRKHVSLYTFCNCDQTPKHGDCFEVMKMKLGGSNVGDVLFVVHIMGR